MNSKHRRTWFGLLITSVAISALLMITYLVNCYGYDDSEAFSHTPLKLSVETGRTLCVRCILALKADPNEGERTGTTPLMVAAEFGRTREAQLLIEAGANVNAGTGTLRPVCRALMRRASKVDMVRLLVNSGAQLEWENQSALDCLYDEDGRKAKFDYLKSLGILTKSDHKRSHTARQSSGRL